MKLYNIKYNFFFFIHTEFNHLLHYFSLEHYFINYTLKQTNGEKCVSKT